MRLDSRYRPKADRELLRALIQDAWQAYHGEHFPEDRQTAIGERLAALLEQRFPLADMEVLVKYGLASAPESASVNVYHPVRERWDVYTSVKLPRPVLCPQSRAHFFVGGEAYRPSNGDHLDDTEFGPFFSAIVTARDAYSKEVKFTPERTDVGYPTWEEIAQQLPVTGPHIREVADHNEGINR